MPTPTDDPFDRLTVLALMRASPGKEAGLKAEREALIEPTGQQDRRTGSRSRSSAAHLDTGHLVRFAGMTGDLLDENGLTIPRLQGIA